eukprot:Skav204911  [mRNA]  locus=scaffold5801:5095:7598:- [translate_table: standard]
MAAIRGSHHVASEQDSLRKAPDLQMNSGKFFTQPTSQGCLSSMYKSFWSSSSQSDSFWLKPGAISGASKSTVGFLYRAGPGQWANYLVWSASMSILVSDNDVTTRCHRHGAWITKKLDVKIRDLLWHQLFFVNLGGNVIRGYVDGQPMENLGPCDHYPTSSWRFGNHACDIGMIGQWKRSLGASEIRAACALLNDPNLVSHYSFADSHDDLGNGPDLQITGGKLSR